MKRVVFVINDLRTGGAERVFSEDATRLAERGHDVAICLLYGSSAHEQFAKTLSPAVRSVELHARSPFDVNAMREFRRFIRDFKPDACLSTLNDANLFARAGLVGIRGVRYLRREANELSMKPWWHRVLDLLMDGRTDGVIAVSESIRGSIARSNPWLARTISVVPNAVALPPAAIRSMSAAVRILAVGSLTAKKDYATLIRACGLLRTTKTAFTLTVVGDGPEREALTRLAQAEAVADVIDFTGRIDHAEIGKWYAEADMFVLASRVEGSPNALLEAMAAGLAAVASDIPSVTEVLDAESGILVPPGEPQALAAALERLSGDQDLRARMGAHAREIIRQRFDPERRLERLEAILYGKAH